MKKLSYTLAILTCMTLFQSSCDLLSDTEDEVMDYVAVDIYIDIYVMKMQREWDTYLSAPHTEDVNVKFYISNDKLKSDEIILNKVITAEQQPGFGAFSFDAGKYYIHKDEIFTISVYAEKFPSVYKTQSISYLNVKAWATKQEKGPDIYLWDAFFALYLPPHESN